MNEKVESLELEQLRQLRGPNDRILEEVRGLRGEIIAMRDHQRGLVLTQDGHHDDILSIKVRLDRIERRLELSGAD